MKRRFRLTRSTDFQRVRRYGKSYAHPLLVLVIYPNEGDTLRIGLTAGRYAGNAVKRNRIKRQLRAAIYPFLNNMSKGWDMVFIARKPIKDASFSAIQDAVRELLKSSGTLNNYGS